MARMIERQKRLSMIETVAIIGNLVLLASVALVMATI
jgi:hypothetical protein